MTDYRTILVPYDFSQHAKAALATAVGLAKRLNTAKLHLVHVIQPAYPYPMFEGAVVVPPANMFEVRRNVLRSLEEIAGGIGECPAQVESHIIEGSNISDLLLKIAERLDADMIVMGTHGRTGIAHVFLGSVTERMLRKAPCPVLTVREANPEAE